MKRQIDESTKKKEELPRRHNDFIREREGRRKGKTNLFRERDELTKTKGDFSSKERKDSSEKELNLKGRYRN
jgi:hypothetical protein